MKQSSLEGSGKVPTIPTMSSIDDGLGSGRGFKKNKKRLNKSRKKKKREKRLKELGDQQNSSVEFSVEGEVYKSPDRQDEKQKESITTLEHGAQIENHSVENISI